VLLAAKGPSFTIATISMEIFSRLQPSKKRSSVYPYSSKMRLDLPGARWRQSSVGAHSAEVRRHVTKIATQEQVEQAIWDIVRQVAERESIFFEQDASLEQWQCPFCNSGQTFHAHVRKEPFIHGNTCVVTKARALMERRKAGGELE
jgi:hypothetical protein